MVADLHRDAQAPGALRGTLAQGAAMNILLATMALFLILDILGRFFPYTEPSVVSRAVAGAISVGLLIATVAALAGHWKLF